MTGQSFPVEPNSGLTLLTVKASPTQPVLIRPTLVGDGEWVISTRDPGAGGSGSAIFQPGPDVTTSSNIGISYYVVPDTVGFAAMRALYADKEILVTRSGGNGTGYVLLEMAELNTKAP